MATDNRLKNIKKEYDLIIVGGGIYGATLLWEATLKGLSAILLEKSDFCSATSANSLKIIHGGLRYLQELDFVRVRESSKELLILMNMAPHLVHPLPCIIPTYKQLSKSKLAYWLGLKLHEVVRPNRNGKSELKNRVPSGKIVSIDGIHSLVPRLELSGITGGALWYDGQEYNSERLVLSFIISAIERGADAFNYMEVQDLIIRNGSIVGTKVHDVLSNQELEIYGKIIVNATGPWINQFSQRLHTNKKEDQFLFAKAVNLIIPRSLSECAFGLKSFSTVDDLTETNRFIFFAPWRGATMIGTWYFQHNGSLDELKLKSNEFLSCIGEIQNLIPSANITADDVCFLHLGLLPVEKKSARKQFTLKMHHSLIDHSRTGGPDGLISVLGVKYTTARNVAVKTLGLVLKKLGKKSGLVNPVPAHLSGGDIENLDEFVQLLNANNQSNLSDQTIRHLAMNYGTNCKKIIELISKNEELGKLVPGSQEVLRAELLYALKKEFPYTLTDLLVRRMDIGSLGKPNQETIEFCAALMGREMGWSESEQQEQIKCLNNYYDRLSIQ